MFPSFNAMVLICSLIQSSQERNCYVDFLLSECKSLTEQQLTMLLWETIIEAADTPLVATEWAIYELAKDPTRQVNRWPVSSLLWLFM